MITKQFVKKLFVIRKDQDKLLKRMSKKLKKTMSSIVREGIDIKIGWS